MLFEYLKPTLAISVYVRNVLTLLKRRTEFVCAKMGLLQPTVNVVVPRLPIMLLTYRHRVLDVLKAACVALREDAINVMQAHCELSLTTPL